MGVQVFAGGLTPGHQEEVIAHERCRVKEADQAEDHQGKGEPEVIYSGAKGDALLALINEDLCERGAQEIESKQGAGGYESEKVAIVTPANAVVEPDTVMILGLDAVIA